MYKAAKIMIAAGVVMILMSVCLTVYNLIDDRRADSSAKSALEALEGDLELTSPPSQRYMSEEEIKNAGSELSPDEYDPGYEILTDEEEREKREINRTAVEELGSAAGGGDSASAGGNSMPTYRIGDFEYAAILNFPSLELELPVINEWSYPGLKTAPCRYSGSVYNDDLVICGHDYQSHFGKLKNLSTGDIIYLTDMNGSLFTYKVENFEIVYPSEVRYMTDSEYDLTFFTCTIGGLTRFTVRCNRAE